MDPSKQPKHRHLSQLVLFHANTLWLFTFSDIKTIVVPSTIFGLVNALAAPVFRIPTVPEFGLVYLGRRSPSVLLWVWLNLLAFNINNQRTYLAVEEDRVNKPWRPLPSGRMRLDQAALVMLAAYVTVHSASIWFGCGIRQALALLVLGAWYNNFGGADCHPCIRNAINSFGYVCFTSGAMEVAMGRPLPLHGEDWMLLKWLSTIAAVIFTTVHAQDMYDQEGDALRGRFTVPLVIGDGLARYTIACWVIIWGFACPRFWESSSKAWGGSVGLSILVAFRTLHFRNASSDRMTFVIWNVWLSFVYVLPVWGINEALWI